VKLKTLISITIFNELCDSTFCIFHNQRQIYHEDVQKNKVKEIIFDNELDFDSFGDHKFKFNWKGSEECAHKWFDLKKVIVNQQKLPVHTVKVMPYDNDYITDLCSTDEGRQKFKQMKLYPGNRHGWYGDYEINFEFGDKEYFNKLSIHSISPYIGIKKERIYVDQSYQQNFHIS